MDRRPCDGTTKGGRLCRSFGLESGRCIMHDPARAEAMTAARARGAVKAAKLRSLEGKRRKLDSPRALVKFLSDVAVDTLSGSIDPSVSRAVVYAVATLRQTMESADLEQRLTALEQQLAQQGTKRWA